MNSYFDIVSFQRRKNNKVLIFEDVYVLDIFRALIDYVIYNIRYKEDLVIIDYNKLMQLLPSNWKVRKYFNKNKKLYILSTSVFTNQCKLKLTQNEISSIINTLNSINGAFFSNFQNDKENSLLIIKDTLYDIQFENICAHELIHFVQWSTGKTIKSIFKDKQYQISDEDKCKIKNILNIEIDSVIKYIATPSELEAYCNTIFYDLKKFCIRYKLPFTRQLICMICSIFENTKYADFQKYYNNVVSKLDDLSLGLVLKINSFAVLLLIGYFKIGFNSFKNHIYSYFDKHQLTKNN